MRDLSGQAMRPGSFPELYERWLVTPLFRPFAEMTLDELGFGPNDRLLDIACGTGILARAAAQRFGNERNVVGIDANPEMLRVARTVAPGIDWREGSADTLPLHGGEQFDVVTCQQGLQFFPDKPAAAAQMRRGLRSGGRLAVTTWRSDDEVPFFRDLRHIAERHLGAISDPRYGYGNATQLAGLLWSAGFHTVTSQIRSLTVRFEDGTSFLRLNAIALVGMSAAGKSMSSEERERITDAILSESVQAQRPYMDGSDLVFEARTNLATAFG